MQRFWLYALLALLCVLAFYPMFRNGFVWDDVKLILENPVLRGLWPPARFLQSQGSALFALRGHRPVMFFSLALDYAIWKLNPFGYHLTNLLLHFLCVIGVAFLAQRLSRSKGAGFLAGALFAILPGHAEGVIAFEGRSDVLATLFVLLGLWGYIAHLNSEGWRRALCYGGSLAAYLLACFSKESGLVLLGILVIYEGFVLGRSAGTWGRRALGLVPFFLIALFYLGYRGRVFGGQMAGSQWWGGGPEKNFLMTFEVYAFYLRLLFYPLKLSPAYRIPVPEDLWDVRVLFGGALLMMSLGGMILALRRKTKAGFFASWFLIGLLPVANFIPVPGAMVAERWLYLPSVGACALGGWGATVLYHRAKGWVRIGWAGFVLLVLVLLGMRTWLWNSVWMDGVSMARAVLAVDPGNPQWHFYLGGSLRFQGQYREAEQELREAIRLNPAFVEAHYNLGFLFLEQGMLEKAAAEYREAIRLNPDFLEALENLAFTLDGLSRRKEAREYWLRAEKLESRPELVARIKKRLAEPD